MKHSCSPKIIWTFPALHHYTCPPGHFRGRAGPAPARTRAGWARWPTRPWGPRAAVTTSGAAENPGESRRVTTGSPELAPRGEAGTLARVLGEAGGARVSAAGGIAQPAAPARGAGRPSARSGRLPARCRPPGFAVREPAAVTRLGGNASARRPCREGGSTRALGSATAARGGSTAEPGRCGAAGDRARGAGERPGRSRALGGWGLAGARVPASAASF